MLEQLSLFLVISTFGSERHKIKDIFAVEKKITKLSMQLGKQLIIAVYSGRIYFYIWYYRQKLGKSQRPLSLFMLQIVYVQSLYPLNQGKFFLIPKHHCWSCLLPTHLSSYPSIHPSLYIVIPLSSIRIPTNQGQNFPNPPPIFKKKTVSTQPLR